MNCLGLYAVFFHKACKIKTLTCNDTDASCKCIPVCDNSLGRTCNIVSSACRHGLKVGIHRLFLSVFKKSKIKLVCLVNSSTRRVDVKDYSHVERIISKFLHCIQEPFLIVSRVCFLNCSLDVKACYVLLSGHVRNLCRDRCFCKNRERIPCISLCSGAYCLNGFSCRNQELKNCNQKYDYHKNYKNYQAFIIIIFCHLSSPMFSGLSDSSRTSYSI